MKIKSLVLLTLVLLPYLILAQQPWLLNFKKAELNPVMTANPDFTFTCPVSGEEVAWQKADVFNPAAVVRNDTVFMLFRAEDNPAAELGGRTSRIGLAYSLDGINFIKYPEPVLYPQNDPFNKWDYPGGGSKIQG